MNNTIKLLLTILLLILTLKVFAEDEELSFATLIGSKPRVEINLGRMMLGLLSSATEEESGISSILSKLDAINVTVFDIEKNNKIDSIKSKINNLVQLKSSSGYEKIATVREDDSLVYVLAKMDNKNLTNLSIFAMDDEDELVLIDINGTILLSQLGDLMDHFDVDLDINDMKFNNQKKKEQ